MMNDHSKLKIVVVCLLVCLTAQAHADPTADVRKIIQAAYDRNSAAGNKKDLDGSMAIYTPDYVSIEKSGKKSDLNASRDQMRQVFNMFKAFKLAQSVQNVQLKGNQAQVTVKAHIEGTMYDAQTKQSHKLVSDFVSNDVWVKTAKGWMIKRSNTISESTKVDGNPLPNN